MLLLRGLTGLFFPPVCMVCNENAPSDLLCTRCLSSLPHTGFAAIRNNPVENVFAGRLNISLAFSEFYFEKSHLVQTLLHHLKYKGSKDAGFFLGECIGKSILSIQGCDLPAILIPLPLHPKKEHKRGYNQAYIICKGISSVTGQEIIPGAVTRNNMSETQTRKHRMERWKNVEGIFSVKDSKAIRDNHVMLVDDVVTTGATLEACGREILKFAKALSIATAAHASK